jgi:predicted GTPase
VLNKVDLGNSVQDYISISAKHGTGIEELKAEIVANVL